MSAAAGFLSGLKSQNLSRRMLCAHVPSPLLGMGYVMPGAKAKICNRGVTCIKSQQVAHGGGGLLQGGTVTIWGHDSLQHPRAPNAKGFLLEKIIHIFIVEAAVKSVLLHALTCIPN